MTVYVIYVLSIHRILNEFVQKTPSMVEKKNQKEVQVKIIYIYTVLDEWKKIRTGVFIICGVYVSFVLRFYGPVNVSMVSLSKGYSAKRYNRGRGQGVRRPTFNFAQPPLEEQLST